MAQRHRSTGFRAAGLAALLATAAFLLAGCERVGNHLPTRFDTAGVRSYCRAWTRLRNAGYRYENNVWNQGAVNPKERVQCLQKRLVDGEVQYGWRWQWPRGNGQVKAYPEVIYGHKPWLTSSTSGTLPRRITTIEELFVSYDIEMMAQGRYNLAFDIWITSSGRPTPADITHEIMIWVGERGRAWEPYPGNRVRKVTIGGADYDLYLRPQAEWLKEHGAPNVAYIAFNRRTAQMSGRIDLKQFLDYLTDNGLLAPEGYVASVELGNEIMYGSGFLWLRNYQISVN